MSDIDNISNALSHIDPHDRDLWLRMGAAIKDELGESGFDIWDQWSSTAHNYDVKAVKSTWKSLKPGHVRINSVFYEAIQHGYRPREPYTPPSPQEQEKRRSEAEQRRLQEIEQQKQAQEKARKQAQYIWQNKTTPASLSHLYLISKGISDPECIRGLRQNTYKDHQNLVIPLYQNKEIVSLQFINQEGDKHYLRNGQKEGSYSLIGDTRKMAEGFYMAEGFATAASVYEATGKPVVVTFDAGNLVNVAQSLRQHYPDTKITIAADNDASQTGIKKAAEAAAVLGENASIVLPGFSSEQIERYQLKHGADNLPSDFNDLHTLAGLSAVKSLLTGDKVPIMEPDQYTEPQQAADQAAFLSPEEKQILSPEKPQETEILPEQETETNHIEPDIDRILEMDADHSENQAAETVPETPETAQPSSENWFDRLRQMVSPKNKTTSPQEASEPLSNQELKKIITDLNYRMPPEGMERRYLVSNGQYLSASNASTVLFEDRGNTLSTARTDTQIAQDMLDVAKAKGWDAIKLSGTREFKQIMYVLAESQGIKTRGYKPTEADKTLVERLRAEHSLNRVEEDSILKQHEPAVQDQAPDTDPAGEKIVSFGYAPYQHDPKNKESPYLVLEKNGNEHTVWGVGLPDALEKSQAQVGDIIELNSLGQQEVEVNAPVKNENGQVIGTEKILTHRNVWEINILTRNQDERLPSQEQPQEKQPHPQPDIDALSQAEKLKAQSSMPTRGQIETSPKADTDIDVPMQEIGQGSIPGEILRQTQDIKTHALDTDSITMAKNSYESKAANLGKPDRAKLNFFERNTMHAIQDLKGDAREDAMRNYYEHMSNKMDSDRLDIPAPMQVPSPAIRNTQLETDPRQPDHEMER